MIDWASLSLRALDAADLPSLHTWQNDPELRDLNMGFRGPVQLGTTEAWLQTLADQNLRNRVAFGVCQASVLVGVAQLHGICWINRTAMLGIHIGSMRDRQKGMGFGATSLLLDYAFNGLDLHRVSLHVLAGNAVAVRLYERLGFRLEGVLRSAFAINRVREDVSIYGMLTSEWSSVLPYEAKRLVRDDLRT